jgi:dinuclear metal center YbgI/SA1388 family protein
MKIQHLLDYLETLFPLHLQEDYDNSGLQLGDPNATLHGCLVALDCTERVVDEAIAKKCNLILTHHPLLFKGIKRIGMASSTERIITQCLKNDMVLYAIHTNLDNHGLGVNKKICDILGLQSTRPLVPNASNLFKLIVFSPKDAVETLHDALCDAGAGKLGNYYGCSFQSEGKGMFTPNEKANPTLGAAHTPEVVEEIKMEYIVPKQHLNHVLTAMHATHPYEEVAYDVMALINKDYSLGSGMVGELKEAVDAQEFLLEVKMKFNCKAIRYTPTLGKNIRRVAVCGGSGSFLLGEALRQKADVYISSDFKYHEFFGAEGKIIIADIGHYESEQFTQDLLCDIIKEKFPTFAVQITEHNTNPINFL